MRGVSDDKRAFLVATACIGSGYTGIALLENRERIQRELSIRLEQHGRQTLIECPLSWTLS
jgi:hypothetical protein